MIYVDELRHYPNTPWADGRACHLVSDLSRLELVSFAQALGCREAWLQDRVGQVLHFDLAPSKRRRAVGMGAMSCDRRAFVEVLRRARERGLVGDRVVARKGDQLPLGLE